MSALSTILSPVSPLEKQELIPLKRENGDEEAPMVKRRRSTPPEQSPLIGVREEGRDRVREDGSDMVGIGGIEGIGGRNEGTGKKNKEKDREERKAKWLAGLTHRELLGVALGAVWSCMFLCYSILPIHPYPFLSPLPFLSFLFSFPNLLILS